MKILVDANVLLRLSNQQHPMYPAALLAVRWIVMNKHDPVIVPQVLYEYWAVATRPVENNGLGIPLRKAILPLGTGWAFFRSRMTRACSLSGTIWFQFMT